MPEVGTKVFVVRGTWKGYSKTRRYFTRSAACWRMKYWSDGCCGGKCDCEAECVGLTPQERKRENYDPAIRCSVCCEGPALSVSLTPGEITWDEAATETEFVPGAVPPGRSLEEVEPWLTA